MPKRETKKQLVLSSDMSVEDMKALIQTDVETGKNYDEMTAVAWALDDPAARATFLAEARRQILNRHQEINLLWKANMFRDLRGRFFNLEEYPAWLQKSLERRRHLSVVYADYDDFSFALMEVIDSGGHKNAYLIVDETIAYDRICEIATRYENRKDLMHKNNRIRAFLLERDEITHLCADADDDRSRNSDRRN